MLQLLANTLTVLMEMDVYLPLAHVSHKDGPTVEDVQAIVSKYSMDLFKSSRLSVKIKT